MVKAQPFLPNQVAFNFSENYVFGKFDTFCDRLAKIIAMFDLVDDYNHLFERRMEGKVESYFNDQIPALDEVLNKAWKFIFRPATG